MSRDDEIRRYFGQPGFERFLAELERRHRTSRNGARGTITLLELREDEREKLDEFFEMYSPLSDGRTHSYSINLFKRKLMERRFRLTVPELLKVLRGKPVLTRQEEMQQYNTAWRDRIGAAVRQIELSGVEYPAILSWAEEIINEQAPGSRTLRAVFTLSPEESQRCMTYCLLALCRVAPGQEGRTAIRLPVLAAEVTGNAHALDWKYPLGRLFWYGLTSITGNMDDTPTEGDTREEGDEAGAFQAILIREGYRRGGIVDDDLSSQVMVYLPEWFGAWEERVLTLRQVEHIDPERVARLSGKRIIMVENPSVFAELIDADLRTRPNAESGTNCTNIPPILICGNGQPTTAVIRLLDMLMNETAGRKLYYAGDMDPAGLGIAHSLKMRYGDAFYTWYMDVGTFLQYAHKGIVMEDKERSRLLINREQWGIELVDAMLNANVKLHQELWLNEMLQGYRYRMRE